MAKKKVIRGKKGSKSKQSIDYRTTVPDLPLEKIIESYERLIYVQASKHIRERVELEDLISEGKQGVIEAYRLYTDPDAKTPNYPFQQAVMYRLSRIFYYCLANASPLRTPTYIQRGCMHVGQIFKILSNQNVAEQMFKRPGPATDQEIIDFIYDQGARLPKKAELDSGSSRYTLEDIKGMIMRTEDDPYFEQILDGMLHHRDGNRHTFVKNNLTDVGKILHIKNKLYFCAEQHRMKYERVIDLILSARVLVHAIDDDFQQASDFDIDREMSRKKVIERGMEIVGEQEFQIFIDSTLNDMTYGKLAEKYGEKKTKISDIINQCLVKLRNDPVFQELYKELG